MADKSTEMQPWRRAINQSVCGVSAAASALVLLVVVAAWLYRLLKWLTA